MTFTSWIYFCEADFPTDIFRTSTKEENDIYFFEKNIEPKIYHLIFANEGSEAGNYYNNFTLDFLEKSYIGTFSIR